MPAAKFAAEFVSAGNILDSQLSCLRQKCWVPEIVVVNYKWMSSLPWQS